MANAFLGIKVAVGILILDAGITMLRKMKKTTLTLSLCILSALILLTADIFALHFSTIVLMLAAGLIGLLAQALSRRKEVSDHDLP